MITNLTCLFAGDCNVAPRHARQLGSCVVRGISKELTIAERVGEKRWKTREKVIFCIFLSQQLILSNFYPRHEHSTSTARAQRSTAQHIRAQPTARLWTTTSSPAQPCTAQYSAAQHSTAHQSIAHSSTMNRNVDFILGRSVQASVILWAGHVVRTPPTHYKVCK